MRNRAQAQSRVNSLNRRLSRVNRMANKGKQLSLSNTYKKWDDVNKKGSKIALFLQSKFRMGKAKNALNRMKNKKDQNNIALAKEKKSQMNEKHLMSFENLNGQNRGSNEKSNKKIRKSKSRRVRPSPPVRRKPISSKNVNFSVKHLPSIRNYMNKSKSMSQKFKPKLSTIPDMVSKANTILKRVKSHWILNGPKATHRKVTVRRITKHAPK